MVLLRKIHFKHRGDENNSRIQMSDEIYFSDYRQFNFPLLAVCVLNFPLFGE